MCQYVLPIIYKIWYTVYGAAAQWGYDWHQLSPAAR